MERQAKRRQLRPWSRKFIAALQHVRYKPGVPVTI
jgi:hypothetical protein